jgi:hypothetical protein
MGGDIINISTKLHTHYQYTDWDFTEYKMCVSIFSAILSKTFLILTRTERGKIKNVYWSSCKYLLFLTKFIMKHEFSKQIKKITYQISWKSVY